MTNVQVKNGPVDLHVHVFLLFNETSSNKMTEIIKHFS